MATRLNYTGRQSILHSDIRIRLEEIQSRLTFQADYELGTYNFPEDAIVVIEVYRPLSAQFKRFTFGHVGIRRAPENRWLDDFGRPEGILFRLKVITKGARGKHLCGEADGIRPVMPSETDLNPLALIDVAPANLGGEPWRLQFPDGLAGLPTLQINERIEGWNTFVRSEIFRPLVMPAVMRQILLEILVLRTDEGDEESVDEWPGKWLKFAQQLVGRDVPDPLADGEQLSERTDLTDWIDDAVSAFGKTSGLMDQLVKFMDTEG